MLYSPTIISIVEVLLVTVPIFLTVAFVTVAERKTMASMQSRLGPNLVGYSSFIDAIKLILRECLSPTQANLVLFFLGPVIILVFSLLGYAVIPYGPGFALSDFDLGILYMLAVSSLATYGILLAGWSANSKYAFLGSLRSTAQLISYELILSSAILLVVLLSGSLNLNVSTEAQRVVWFIMYSLPIFVLLFVLAVRLDLSTPPRPHAFSEYPVQSISLIPTAASVAAFTVAVLYVGVMGSEVSTDNACVSACLSATSEGLINIPIDVKLSNGTIIQHPILINHLFAHHDAFLVTKDSLLTLTRTLSEGSLNTPASPASIHGLPEVAYWVVLCSGIFSGFILLKFASPAIMWVNAWTVGKWWGFFKYFHLIGQNEAHLFSDGVLQHVPYIMSALPYLDNSLAYISACLASTKDEPKQVFIGALGGVLGAVFMVKN